MIDPSIDEVRIIQRQFRGPIDDIIGRLDTQHETMILVTDFVAPAAEAAAGVDVFFLEAGEELCEDGFALEGGGRVAVVEAAVVGGHDFVGGLEHFGRDEAFDAVGQHVGVVDGLQGGFGDFEHDGPVGAFARGGVGGLLAGGDLQGGQLFGGGRLVVGGVVGEDGGAVEGAVGFGEVEPAFVAYAGGALAAYADADYVGGRVEEIFAEGDEGFVAHHLDERVDAHGVD